MHIHIIVAVNSFGLSLRATLHLLMDMLEYFLIPVTMKNVALIQSDLDSCLSDYMFKNLY